MDANHEGKSCKCVCHKFNGLLVALIGVDFLLGRLGILAESQVALVWPILLIFVGLKSSVGRGVCKCCKDS